MLAHFTLGLCFILAYCFSPAASALRRTSLLSYTTVFDTGLSSGGYKGIANEGASCYVNSVMQALYHIRGFRKDVLELEPQNDFTQHFKQVFRHLETTSHSYIRIPKFLSLNQLLVREGRDARAAERFLQLDQADDAHFFYQWCIDNFQPTSIVNKWFTRSEVVVLKPLKEGLEVDLTNTDSPRPREVSIVVNLMKEPGVPQFTSLSEFMAYEEVVEYVFTDGSKKLAKKPLLFNELPKVLSFALARVKYSGKKDEAIYNDSKFSFTDVIELEHATAGNTSHESVKYRLRSVIFHDKRRAHFYTAADVGKEEWMLFDDSQVKEITRREVLKSGEHRAWMLFYELESSSNNVGTTNALNGDVGSSSLSVIEPEYTLNSEKEMAKIDDVSDSHSKGKEKSPARSMSSANGALRLLTAIINDLHNFTEDLMTCRILE